LLPLRTVSRVGRAPDGALRGHERLHAMVLEIGLIQVTPGSEEDFAAAYRKARPILASTPGCRSVRMTRGIESPSRFVLLVEWDNLESHEHGFRGTDRFARWRELIGPYFAEPPAVEHAVDVPSGQSR
jgi:heme-degrading monooxygenase HmoA